MIDLIGHVAYVLIFIGMILLTKKDWIGWVFRFFGEAMWVGIGLYLGMTSIWVWGLIFMGIDAYAITRWKSIADKNTKC